VTIAVRICKVCSKDENEVPFYEGRDAVCKEHRKRVERDRYHDNRLVRLAHVAEYREANRDLIRVRTLARKYRLTIEQVKAKLAQPFCDLCRDLLPESSKHRHFDHDHATDKLRGVLCHSCNTGLGLFKDDPQRLIAAILYLSGGRNAP